jgi:hypothetical protein
VLFSGSFALFLVLVGLKFDPRFGFTELAGFGDTWEARRTSRLSQVPHHVKPRSNGYDGQFYAQIALDPALRDADLTTAIDAPAYRARRILLPATAHALGFGRPAAVLQVYCLLNVACWIALGFLLLHWIPMEGIRDFARWAACMFSMGVLDSVRLALTDMPALLLVLVSMLLLARAREVPAALAGVLAVLTKETSILGLGHFFAPSRLRDRAAFVRSLAWVAVAAGAFVLWMTYVSTRFGEMGLQADGNITFPFSEFMDAAFGAIAELSRARFDTRYAFRLAAMAGLTIQFAWLVWHRQPASAMWRLGMIYAILFVCLGSNVWHGYWAACRLALPMTVAFNVLLPKNRAFWPLLVLSNLPVIHAVIRWL